MAFFKFRKASGDGAAPALAASESVQALRRRARHRLIGATVLVLVGVIGFPLVFDNQPRPIAVDIPIEIPDKNKVKPLGAASASGASGAAPSVAHGGSVVDESRSAPAAKEEIVATGPGNAPGKEPTKAQARDAGKDATKAPSASVSEPTTRPTAKDVVKEPPKERKDAGGPGAAKDGKAPAAAPGAAPGVEAAKAQALLEGREPAATPAPVVDTDAAPGAKGRFVVQVGSYVDMVKAREARMKMERAGFKTYTQEVSLKDGKRLRVRVGPFETRAQAEKAAAKAKALELSGAILEL